MRALDVIEDVTCAPGRRGRRHPDRGSLPPPAGSPRPRGAWPGDPGPAWWPRNAAGVLLIDETSLRRGRRRTCRWSSTATPARRWTSSSTATAGRSPRFLLKQSRSWRRGVKVALHRRVDPAGGRRSGRNGSQTLELRVRSRRPESAVL